MITEVTILVLISDSEAIIRMWFNVLIINYIIFYINFG